MKKSILTNFLGLIVGCLIVVGSGAGYWFWLQQSKAQPENRAESAQKRQESTSPPKLNTNTNFPLSRSLSQQLQNPNKPNSLSAQNSVKPTKIRMQREIAGGEMYAPGHPVDVTITLTSEGTDPVRALGIEERIPAGWRFDSILDGVRPDITPRRPESQLLEFAWFNIPEFPASFTYRLIAESGAGRAEIDGETIFRTSGPEHRSEAVKTALDPAGLPISQPAPPPPPTQTRLPMPVPSYTSDFSILYSGDETPYKPGVTIPLEVTIDYAAQATVTALALRVMVPPGWVFGEVVGGEKPAVARQDQAGEINFVWINTPPFPNSTRFTLTAPESASGQQTIKTQVVYRTDGDELRSPEHQIALLPGG